MNTTETFSHHVDMDRFLATLERSSAIGTGRAGGLSRLSLTDADRKMRDVFVAWCREADLVVQVDELGSIFARRPGREDHLPPVLLGSHLDTQVNGGRFDGVVGVLGALEVVRRLNDLDHVTRRPIEIVNWANEEGARFSPPMTASGGFVGAYDPEWVRGRRSEDGATFGEELERIGYRGERPCDGRPYDSYFELHIEQGPLLEEKGRQVGIVTHGYASHGLFVRFSGETAHTGSWPMERRRNALAAGARWLAMVDDIGWDFAGTGGKATAASLAAWPNRPGTLSETADAVCDVRHEDPRTARVMAERMRRAAFEAGARSGCHVEVTDEWQWGGGTPFDPVMIENVRRTADQLGYSWFDLPSQVGHDAYFLARHCPTALIFTPCRNGVTHNNSEFASPDDLRPGLDVLLNAVVRRADAS